MPTDRVLIEIVTAANMAGLNEAHAGLLSMNPAALGLGLALGAMGVAAKDAAVIAESTAKANNNLKQAIAENNAQAGKAIEVGGDLTKVTAAHDAAVRHLAEVQAGMPTKHRATTLELMHLQDAQKKAADTARELAAAEEASDRVTMVTAINSKALQTQITNFIQTNRDYISNQSDVTNSYAQLIRAGLSQAEIQRVMNDAVDLAAIRGISLTDAVTALSNAEFGRMRGLIDLGITTAKYTDANGNLIQSQHSVKDAMAEVDAKVKGGRGTLTELEQTTNRLHNDWQDVANVLGVPVLSAFDAVIKKADEFYGALAKGGSQAPSPILQEMAVGAGLAYQEWVIRGHPEDAARAWYKKNWPAAYKAVYGTIDPDHFGSEDTSGPPKAGPGSYEASQNATKLLNSTGQGATVTVLTIGSTIVPPIVQAQINASIAARAEADRLLAKQDQIIAHLNRIEVATNAQKVSLAFNVQGLSPADQQTARIFRKAMQV